MNPIVKEHPKLRPFARHGVNFVRSTDTQGVGDCPFCGKQQKFYVNTKSQAWDCKVCGRQGGFHKFLECAVELYQKMITPKELAKLAKDRKLKPSTLKAWGIGSDGAGTYWIPVRIGNEMIDVRHYRIGGRLRSTPGTHGPLVMKISNASKIVWICEGEWDAMACWEAIKRARGKVDDSVVGVTGANAFPQRYGELFHGRSVILCFDNDDAGDRGDARCRMILSGYTKDIKSIHWPRGIEVGSDLRDLFISCGKKGKRTLNKLAEFIKKDPRKLQGAEDSVGDSVNFSESNEDLTGAGLPFDEVVTRYREHLHLPVFEPLEVIYGTAFANRIQGDPLWLFVVGPPGCGKTELLMSLHEAPLVVTTTTLTPSSLMSGATSLGGGDPSLIPRLKDRTLVVKDFTTILDMHPKDKEAIFGILRDAFDGRIEKWFGTGIHRVYESRFAIMAAVTPKIEEESGRNSMLGERFLKYRMPMRTSLTASEMQIMRALKNIGKQDDLRAKLMDISAETLNRPIKPDDVPTVPEEMYGRFIKLSQWVARMRGVVNREKYTGEMLHKPVTEIGTRLAQQLCKLAMGVAIFHHRDRVSEHDYRIAARVARDTAPDRVEEVVRQLWLQSRDQFASTAEISEWTKFPRQTMLSVLQDLNMLGVVQRKKGDRGGGMWKLSRSIVKLMKPLGIYDKEERWVTRGGTVIGPRRERERKMIVSARKIIRKKR